MLRDSREQQTMAGTLVLIQKRNYDANGLGGQQLVGGGGKKKKYKGSLVIPLGPGDLVSTAHHLWEGRAVKTEPITAIKNQPTQLCGQSVTRDASCSRPHAATGAHVSLVTWVCCWK